MQEDNNVYIGKIKTYKEQFGFIESELGDNFFHKTGLKSDFLPQRNDEVEFRLKPSKNKTGMFDAHEIVLVKKAERKEEVPAVEECLLGTVKWFDETKGFGFISTDEINDCFIHKSKLLFTSNILAGDFVVFCKKINKGKLSAEKCQPFISYLNNCSLENQRNFLNNYLSKFDTIYSSNLQLIKSIIQADKIEETVKDTFLKSAFEKATAETQFKMIFEENLIDIKNETTETQVELLSKLYRLDYDKIKYISQSEKIEVTAKDAFLKSLFEKYTAEYQYKMIFEDSLINFQNENSERQIDLLSKLYRLDYDKIKSISQSEKIEVTAKNTFLKSLFEKYTAEYQFKMLFEDNLIDFQNENSESQIELMSKFKIIYFDKIKTISESDKLDKTVKDAFLKSVFEKASAEYQYKMLFEDNLINIQNETSQSQIELLQKYLTNIYLNWRGYDREYVKIKLIAQSDLIEVNAKDTFLKSAFEVSTAECQFKMLFEDNLINIQNETSENQIELLSKFDRFSYNKIVLISQSNKIDETVKDAFLKSVFEKSTTENQYKMLCDRLFIPFKDQQIELLQNYLSELSNIDYSKYNKIKSIAQSNKIDVMAIDAFLKSVFNKASAGYQYKMLFVDDLINIQNETSENQIKLLSKFANLSLDKIKIISQSNKFEKKSERLIS